MSILIGRETSTRYIQERYSSDLPEFVVVYGRMGVGKTTLVEESFKNGITFRHTPLSPLELRRRMEVLKSKDEKAWDGKKMRRMMRKEQLKHFFYSLKLHGYQGDHVPKRWDDAFLFLTYLLKEMDNGSPQVVFIDELSWLDTPDSQIISALEWFWNSWAYFQPNMKLVVCDSNVPWIRNKVLGNIGGLYGRVTEQIYLTPFNLRECREYYRLNRIEMTDYDILRSYMVFGGIPYYMNFIKTEKTLDQNINDLFFVKDAGLFNEYERLIELSLPVPDIMKNLISFIGSRHKGYTQKEILNGIKGAREIDSVRLDKLLKTLVDSDLVTDYIPYGSKDNVKYYRLSDPFCMFFLRIVQGVPGIQSDKTGNALWPTSLPISKSDMSRWMEAAFTEVCVNHDVHIRQALGVNGVACITSLWPVPGNKSKDPRLDLLIIRRDNIINMCEMKFSSEEYEVSEEYDMTIRHQMGSLENYVPADGAIHPVAITPLGIKRGMYMYTFLRNIALEDLFEPIRKTFY